MSAPSPFPVPARSYIDAVRANPELSAIAVALFSEHARALLVRAPKTAITRSDAGRCGAQVAAEIAGQYDIPDDNFSSRDKGSLLGLWRACFLKVAIEFRHPEFLGVLEVESEREGIVGHSDLTVFYVPNLLSPNRGAAVWTWETKNVDKWDVVEPHRPALSKKDGRVLHEPETRYITQTALGALSEGSPTFSVSIFGLGSAYAQGDYDTASWAEAVDDEYDRVARGERDPQVKWHCEVCRFSRCPMNKNPNRAAFWPGVTDMAVAS